MEGLVRDWDGDVTAARALQSELAREVVRRDQFSTPLRTIAGFHVAFHHDNAEACAGVVMMDARTLQVIDEQLACLPTRAPYIRGLRGFRELPALLAALSRLRHPPDLAFLDGHGIAHPRRLGIAAHLGVLTGVPSIGVGTSILLGSSITNLHDMRGAFTPLRDGREQIGWLLRSNAGCAPLVVSPGHKVALASAPELVMRFVGEDRWPEPIRLAAHIATRPGPPRTSPRL